MIYNESDARLTLLCCVLCLVIKRASCDGIYGTENLRRPRMVARLNHTNLPVRACKKIQGTWKAVIQQYSDHIICQNVIMNTGKNRPLDS
jgi:hypothetical protein